MEQVVIDAVGGGEMEEDVIKEGAKAVVQDFVLKVTKLLLEIVRY